MLHQAGGGGVHHVRRNRADDDKIHRLQIEGMLALQLFHGFDGEVAGGYALVGKVAFADADSVHDPFVGSVHHFFQIGVGQEARRNVTGYTRDFCGFAASHVSPCRKLAASGKD